VSPFSKAYAPQLDAKAIKRQARASKTSTANREAGMQSANPDRRRAATGTLEGIKSSQSKADKTNSRM
jgi:hypothetical protein